MTARQRRFAVVVAVLLTVGVAAALVLHALRGEIVFFRTPTQVLAGEAPVGQAFRLGGLVEEGSVQRDGLQVRFAITDTAQRVSVVYQGLLPDLFREGQGVVAQGRLDAQGLFHAQQVLAKHDENYMPPEASEAMSRAVRSSVEEGAR